MECIFKFEEDQMFRQMEKVYQMPVFQEKKKMEIQEK